jgi:hypothetical protein
MQQELVNGASTRVVVNSKIVGFATDVSIRRSQGVKAIYGVDVVTPQEIAVTGPYSVTGTMAGLRVRDIGGHDGFGIVNASTVQDMLNQKYCVLELVDRANNVTYARVVGVIFDRDSITSSSKNLNTFNASFQGLFYYNETSDAKG